MRLTSLRLTRYGPFEDLALTLDPRPGCLNLICAPNGAGKSVLRQAFGDLLFGIGGKSPMGFRFSYTGMHIAATAQTAAGEAIAFGRRKGMGNTLTDADGAPADALSLAGLLGNTDRDALERLFALDTDRLRRGGDDLMSSGGLVGEALLSAGGLSHARLARRALEERVEKLAPARKAAGKPFYVAADRFVAARRQAAEALLKPDAWERAAADIAEAEAALGAAKAKAEAAQAAMTRLQRQRRVRPILAEIDAAAAWLRDHPDAPELPASLAGRFDAARAGARAASEKLQAETARAARLTADHDAIEVDAALVAQADGIELLAEQAGAAANAQEGDVRLRARLAQVDAQIARKLRLLGTPAAPQDPAALIPPRALETRTRALIREHGTHDAACRDAARRSEALAADIAARRAAMGQPAEASPVAHHDVATLAALLEEVRAPGDPAARARELAARDAAARAAVTAALAETPFWTGDAPGLRAVVLPAMALMDRVHGALVRADAAQLAAAAEAQKARLAMDGAIARLRDIVGDRTVPDRRAVAEARARREGLWDRVALAAFGPPAAAGQHGAPEGAARAAELPAVPLPGGPPQHLALAYERAVREADALADRRADESALIEQAREAERQIALAEADHAAAAARLAAAASALETAQGAWQALLPAELPPACRLDDVRSFAAARSRVVERMEDAAVAAAAHADLAARHQAWRVRLAAALPHAAGDLFALVAEAARLIAQETAADKQRATLAAALATLEQQHKDAAIAGAEAEAARAAWRRAWAEALAMLGRPPDETPGATEDILRLFGELDADVTEAAELRARLAEIARHNDGFTAQVRGVVAHATPDAAPPDGIDAALVLLRRLRATAQAARKCEAQREQLRGQIGQAERHIAELGRALTLREAELLEVLDLIGAPGGEAAEAMLAMAASRASHQAGLSAAEERLLREGDGLDEAALRAELAMVSAEDVAAALAGAAAEAQAAQRALEEHAAAAALLRQALARREAETSYSDAVAAQNEAAASAGRVLREALVARLAASLLGNALDAVERQASPAMLNRIGHWFAQLTRGAYPHVGTEQTEDGVALVLTQAGHPHEPKRVGQLSEGTRDQLYLALRLAAIEAHPVALPFVADDILQTSDDDRAEAAMAALVALSARTQVILLTHHRHVAALGQRVFGDAVNLGVLD